MMHQTIFDTSELLRLLGIDQVIICPGSRNAPLTISFVQNPGIKNISVVDERSAGFIAMGIAQASGKPVVVCCTSGSAILNFGPACAEAFYQEVPVIFISADRPPEWIDQGDGQTIRQSNLLSPHVKASYDLPVDLNHPDAEWEYRRKLNEAVSTANTGIKGPVHVNIPFREPFYPKNLDQLQFSKKLSITQHYEAETFISEEVKRNIREEWAKYERKLFVLGQDVYSSDFLSKLSAISAKQEIPVVADIISNAGLLKDVITKQDLFLADPACAETLKPDLVITFGKTLISKNLKIALRKELDHWTIGNHRPLDTFKNLRKVLPWESISFLELISNETASHKDYKANWLRSEDTFNSALEELLDSQPFSEFWVFRQLMSSLPSDSHVHLSNSMAVRYANFFTPKEGKQIAFHCNRGTSGIDGPVSTAVGFASVSVGKNILVTGDLSALYDRNAFLNDLAPNLKIIVSNNGGGGIFDLIPGPKVLQDQDRNKYFETRHQLTFQRLADEIQYDYWVVNNKNDLLSQLKQFLHSDQNGLLEIQTNPEINGEVYRKVKVVLKEKSPFGDS